MTSGSAGSSVSGRPGPGARILPILLAACLAAAPPPAAAPEGVEEEDIAGILAGYRSLLDEGRQRLASLDFAEAIDAFTKLIDAYKTGKIPLVTSDARLLVAKGYEGRALALANLGRNPDASADFEALIRFDPAYAIDLKGISPKIVSLYSGVRKKIVGVLTVEGDPIGSEAALNEQSLGLTPVADRDVIAGAYRLRVTHEGFDPFEEEIRVEAGGHTARKYHLVPNARSIQVATVPRGVKVLVDGRERGATFGSAGPAYAEVAKEMGMTLADVSEPLLVEYLSPGKHEMTLRKECHEDLVVSVPIEVDPNNNVPVAYKPFVLKPSIGSLEIDSEPGGARVTLDGKPAGVTPLALKDVCSGRHDVHIEKAGFGRFTGQVEARSGETVRVTQRLRLSLAAIDLRPGRQQGETLGDAFAGLARYNVIAPGSGVPAEIAERVRLEVENAQGKGLSERTLREVMEALHVEMLGLAVPVGSLGDQIEFQLHGPLHAAPDRLRLEAAGTESLRRVRFALDADLEVERPWSGVKLIDTRATRHPVVLSVTPGSPAAVAGVAAGDLLAAAGTAPIAKASDFQAVVSKSRPGDEIALTLETAGKKREVRLRFLATPVLLSSKDPDLLYNKAIADLLQAVALTSDPARRAYAWLNVGAALMHFGQWEAAIREAFKKADLPDAAGISRGTVRYLTGVCYEKLGLPKEARTAYADASSSATATLESHDGALVAPSAKRRAASLGDGR